MSATSIYVTIAREFCREIHEALGAFRLHPAIMSGYNPASGVGLVQLRWDQDGRSFWRIFVAEVGVVLGDPYASPPQYAVLELEDPELCGKVQVLTLARVLEVFYLSLDHAKLPYERVRLERLREGIHWRTPGDDALGKLCRSLSTSDDELWSRGLQLVNQEKD